MPLTAEQTTRLEIIRGKMLRDQATLEEEMEAFKILQTDRIGAQVASTKARTAKAEAGRPVDTAAILAGLKMQVFTKGEKSPQETKEGTFKL